MQRIDLDLAYAMDNQLGSWFFQLQLTRNSELDFEVRPGDVQSLLGTEKGPTKLRGLLFESNPQFVDNRLGLNNLNENPDGRTFRFRLRKRF